MDNEKGKSTPSLKRISKLVAPAAPIQLNNGQTLTQEQFDQSAKNGLPFNTMQDMADWTNQWARGVKPSFNLSPVYRVYGGKPNISGEDIALLHTLHANDPQMMNVLNRNIAPTGEVPMYGPDDADIINNVLSKYKQDNPQYNPVNFRTAQVKR